MKSIAIIPARGGSKRIPKKNIKHFLGKPIISYSIITAQKSNIFDKIIVSTDDDRIADISKEYGADIPFIRPANLADDHTTTVDVINHAINWLNKNGNIYDAVCCIYPTAPFIRISDLKKGLELLKGTDVNFAFPVTTFASSIFRALKQTQSGRLKMFWPENQNTRTQDLPETYHDVGQFYWGKTNSFIRNQSVLDGNSYPIGIPRHLAQDIDTEEDWEQAELLYQFLRSREESVDSAIKTGK